MPYFNGAAGRLSFILEPVEFPRCQSCILDYWSWTFLMRSGSPELVCSDSCPRKILLCQIPHIPLCQRACLTGSVRFF